MKNWTWAGNLCLQSKRTIISNAMMPARFYAQTETLSITFSALFLFHWPGKSHLVGTNELKQSPVPGNQLVLVALLHIHTVTEMSLLTEEQAANYKRSGAACWGTGPREGSPYHKIQNKQEKLQKFLCSIFCLLNQTDGIHRCCLRNLCSQLLPWLQAGRDTCLATK